MLELCKVKMKLYFCSCYFQDHMINWFLVLEALFLTWLAVCRMCSVNKVLLKISGKYLCRSLFLIKLQVWGMQFYQKGDSDTSVFLWILLNFLEHLRWLLLLLSGRFRYLFGFERSVERTPTYIQGGTNLKFYGMKLNIAGR